MVARNAQGPQHPPQHLETEPAYELWYSPFRPGSDTYLESAMKSQVASLGGLCARGSRAGMRRASRPIGAFIEVAVTRDQS